MRVIIQRSKSASVSIRGNLVSKIDYGLTILVGFTDDDTKEDVDYLVKKIIHLRIFLDEEGKMNQSIMDINGQILSVSQFTLYADTKKGNRPSYKKAMKSEDAIHLYNYFNESLSRFVKIKTGVFGEDMLVNLENDGPVTIFLDSKEKGL